ncbi:tetraacyldisaccharide 4'-kinase [Shivajiella indica]|uniref:Tetraacyldisaccharide 4'-kinase n=1 Tax=Shivajiella indica TaxID=872115 RepID=A0ABW5B8P7_9BACT
MPWYDPLLYPFALIYDEVTKIRNKKFDTGQKKSVSFTVPTIVVGNLNLGGSGKTPMVEFLIDMFQDEHDVATLSRGYGRKTKGFLLAKPELGPSEMGDEPYQIYFKFGNKVTVAVGEKRVLAIPKILLEKPKTDLIILDDAFQHRYVKGDFYILLTTFQKPFFTDKVLPLGTLRENAKGAIRADVIIVTKTPVNAGEEIKKEFRNSIKKITDTKVIFAGIRYGEPYPINPNQVHSFSKVVLVSGIANDKLFIEEAQRYFQVLEIFSFGDHHNYTVKDIEKISESVKKHQDCMVLTTEKDSVKLKNKAFRLYLSEIPIFALPIKIHMDKEDSHHLKQRIKSVIKEKAYFGEV